MAWSIAPFGNQAPVPQEHLAGGPATLPTRSPPWVTARDDSLAAAGAERQAGPDGQPALPQPIDRLAQKHSNAGRRVMEKACIIATSGVGISTRLHAYSVSKISKHFLAYLQIARPRGQRHPPAAWRGICTVRGISVLSANGFLGVPSAPLPSQRTCSESEHPRMNFRQAMRCLFMESSFSIRVAVASS